MVTEALLRPIRVKYDLPALGGAVVTSGGLWSVGAVGVRKYGSSVPVSVNDQFHLGSCTKSMTATLIAMLVEQKKLRWEDTVGTAFPELVRQMKPAYRNVTMRQLLAHRGGFAPPERSYPPGTDWWTLPGTPRQQRLIYVRAALQLEPAAGPGTKYLYSNMGYTVAAAMAERAADQSWEALMRERLFRPLGMKSAGFGAMGKPGAIVQPWPHRVEDGKPKPVAPGPRADNADVIAPGGKVHCSLPDWCRYLALHLQDEPASNKLLSQESLKELHTPPFGGEYGYGWLFTEREWGGGRVLTHAGSNTMNFTVVWMAPRRDFAVVAATNQGGGKEAQACDEAVWALIQQYQRSSKSE